MHINKPFNYTTVCLKVLIWDYLTFAPGSPFSPYALK